MREARGDALDVLPLVRQAVSEVLRHRDPRFEFLPIDPSYYRCPATDCATEDHGIFITVIRGPDGRQRAVWACAEHLPTEIAARINDLRLKSPLV